MKWNSLRWSFWNQRITINNTSKQSERVNSKCYTEHFSQTLNFLECEPQLVLTNLEVLPIYDKLIICCWLHFLCKFSSRKKDASASLIIHIQGHQTRWKQLVKDVNHNFSVCIGINEQAIWKTGYVLIWKGFVMHKSKWKETTHCQLFPQHSFNKIGLVPRLIYGHISFHWGSGCKHE